MTDNTPAKHGHTPRARARGARGIAPVSERYFQEFKNHMWEARRLPLLVRQLSNLLNYQLRSGKPYFLPKKGRVGTALKPHKTSLNLTCLSISSPCAWVYLVDLNATQAAIRAGYSKKTARMIGYENLTKPYMLDLIAKAQAKRTARTEITQDMVLEELKKIGFADIRKAVRWGKCPGGDVDPDAPERAKKLCSREPFSSRKKFFGPPKYLKSSFAPVAHAIAALYAF